MQRGCEYNVWAGGHKGSAMLDRSEVKMEGRILTNQCQRKNE